MPRLVQATDDAIAQAAHMLGDGQVVAFATETVYGLGADTFHSAAIERVYRLKDRPQRNPLIAHVLDQSQAARVVAQWDERCRCLAEQFWPGPLTIIIPRGADVPDRATAGWSTIAVRAPSHPLARRLLSAFGGPISAPSANRSGHVSPTTAQHVADDFADDKDLMILDGGPCGIGIESTVVDLSGTVAQVLRPGAISIEQLRGRLGEVAMAQSATQTAAPGTSARHYAPFTPTELIGHGSLPDRLNASDEPAVVLCFDPAEVSAPHRSIVMPRSPQEYAARLYGALREADLCRAKWIVIEIPPSIDGLWLAIHDRLRRATERRGRDGPA